MSQEKGPDPPGPFSQAVVGEGQAMREDGAAALGEEGRPSRAAAAGGASGPLWAPEMSWCCLRRSRYIFPVVWDGGPPPSSPSPAGNLRLPPGCGLLSSVRISSLELRSSLSQDFRKVSGCLVRRKGPGCHL